MISLHLINYPTEKHVSIANGLAKEKQNSPLYTICDNNKWYIFKEI